MKEIKAYVHRSRVADVIAALKESSAWGGESGDARHSLAVYLVRGMVAAPYSNDRHYSTDLGDEVVNEYKLELLCEEAEVEELVRVIAASAHTGSPAAGWITVSSLDEALRIQ
jgi:nitrogen regulatory protein P-II 1